MMKSLLATCFVLVVPGLAAAQVTLVWKLEAGDRFALVEKAQVRQTIKLMNSETRQDVNQARRSRISVLKKNADGSLVVEQKFENVKVEPSGEGPDFNTKALKQLEGSSFWFHVDAQGQIGRVEGYDTLVKQLVKENFADAKLIRSVLTEESFKRGVESWLGFVPKTAVEKGKSWQNKSSLPLGPLGAMAVEKTYTLKDFDKNTQTAKITFTGRGTYQAPADDTASPLKVTGGLLRLPKFSGSISFNVDKGRLIESETRFALEGKLAATLNNASVDLELTQEQTVTVKCEAVTP
jgi:hypothetical protein